MSRLTTYVYDLSGNIVEKDLANGTKEVRAHDGRNRISTLKNETAGNSPIAGYAYGYDLAGNVRQVSEIYTSGSLSSRTITNGYDGVYRLTQEAIATTGGGTVTTTYAYDKGHNRTSKAISGGATTNYVLGDGTNGAGANQIVSETTGSLTTAYAYDNNGNRSSRTVGSTATTTGTVTNGSPTITAIPSTAAVAVGMVVSGTSITAGTRVTAIVSSSSVTMSANATGSHTGEAITFTAQTDASSYDDENRLLSLDYETASTGTGTYTYAYDYRTRRVTRTEPGPVTTNIIFNGGVSIEEYTSSAGSPTVEYIRGHDYGGGVGGLEYSVRSSTPSFNFYDSRGDVTTKTNGSGTVTYQTGYEAFGNQTVSSGTTPTDRQRASTKEQDPTGLLNEGFRYRDLSTGTFLTRDPLGFKAGLNNYTYVKQNPWTKFDPEGLDSTQPNPPPPPPPPPPPSTSKNDPPAKQTAPANQPASTSGQAPDAFAGLPSLSVNMQTQDQKTMQADAEFDRASGAASTPPDVSARSTSSRVEQGLLGVGSLALAVVSGAATIPAGGSTVIDGPVGITAASLAALGAATAWTYGMANLGAAFSPNTPNANATAAKVQAMPSTLNQLAGYAIAGQPGQTVGTGVDFATGLGQGITHMQSASNAVQKTGLLEFGTTTVDFDNKGVEKSINKNQPQYQNQP